MALYIMCVGENKKRAYQFCQVMGPDNLFTRRVKNCYTGGEIEAVICPGDCLGCKIGSFGKCSLTEPFLLDKWVNKKTGL